MQVAVLGTGTMGTGMARSLLRADHRVSVWNRTRERAEPLAADGAVVAPTPEQAVAGADAILTMLFDADAVVGVMAEAMAAVPADAVWVQSATVGMAGVDRVARLADEHGVAVVDAPVLGTKQPAEQGALVSLVAGDDRALERARPVLDAIGHKTVRAGERLGQGTALKLACNAWIASLTAAVGQSLALAETLGVRPELFLQAIGGGQPDSPYAHLKGEAMLAGDYPTSFALDGLLKDLDLVTEAGQAARFPVSLLNAVRACYARASADGRGRQDIAAVHSGFRVGD